MPDSISRYEWLDTYHGHHKFQLNTPLAHYIRSHKHPWPNALNSNWKCRILTHILSAQFRRIRNCLEARHSHPDGGKCKGLSRSPGQPGERTLSANWKCSAPGWRGVCVPNRHVGAHRNFAPRRHIRYVRELGSLSTSLSVLLCQRLDKLGCCLFGVSLIRR